MSEILLPTPLVFIKLGRLPTIRYAPVFDENPIPLENRIRERQLYTIFLLMVVLFFVWIYVIHEAHNMIFRRYETESVVYWIDFLNRVSLEQGTSKQFWYFDQEQLD